jgi:hypothetical protein
MSFHISRILHAGYLLESQGTRIVFDPLFETPFSQNCYAFPEVEFDLEAVRQLKPDAIFISHYHDDHFSMESLQHLNRQTPIYFFSVFEELFDLLKVLGFEKVQPIQLENPIQIGPFKILPLEALDADVDTIFHIQVEHLHLLHVVDSWIGPQTFSKLIETKWDLVLWPFQTMRELEVIAPSIAEKSDQLLPHEWLEQLQALKPKAIVPSSCQFRFEEWSWLNKAFFPISYASFELQIREVLPKTQVLRLNPGETLLYSSEVWLKQGRLNWIKPLRDQNADYPFDASIKPQATSEIAQKFSPLTNEQSALVQAYCQFQIQNRWRSMRHEESPLFSAPYHWRLKVCDHTGSVQEYHYEIKQNQIHLENLTEAPSWETEIPAAKLYAALTQGESLTSLYIRVIPAKDIDPLEDPLIRCLYEGFTGSYQKAQLLKLGY